MAGATKDGRAHHPIGCPLCQSPQFSSTILRIAANRNVDTTPARANVFTWERREQRKEGANDPGKYFRKISQRKYPGKNYRNK